MFRFVAAVQCPARIPETLDQFSTDGCHITLRISRRKLVARAQGRKLHGTADEKSIWASGLAEE
jgi:hypothetical protein